MNNVRIGKNLLVVMAQKNVRTIAELSNRTGVSRVTLSKIINDKADSLSLTTVIRICHGLDIEVSDLIKVKQVS